jgi:LysM repeat protein
LALSVLINFDFMNASNPFQIPSCLQASYLQRRRERFKKSVIIGVGIVVALLTGLLILGCKSEHDQAASANAVSENISQVKTIAFAPTLATEPPTVVTPKTSTSSPIAAPAIVSKTGATAPTVQTATIYVVKPADSLSRIAKVHGTTVSALKAANGLDTDRIAIGMKLKLPEA